MNINYPNTKLNNIYETLSYLDNDLEINGDLKVINIRCTTLNAHDIGGTTLIVSGLSTTNDINNSGTVNTKNLIDKMDVNDISDVFEDRTNIKDIQHQNN